MVKLKCNYLNSSLWRWSHLHRWRRHKIEARRGALVQVAVGECRHGQQGRRRQRCRAHHASPPSACGLNLRRVGLLVPKA